MSRTKTRARQRRARIATEIGILWARVCQAPTPADRIAATDDLVRVLKWVADSDHFCLWSFFEEFFGPDEDGSIASGPKTPGPKPGRPGAGAWGAQADVDEMRALIAQLVAPHLAGRPPRRVYEREEHAVSEYPVPDPDVETEYQP